MTIVPKKKSDARPANKQGQAVVSPETSAKQQQDKEGLLDGDQQVPQQQQEQPHQSQQQPESVQAPGQSASQILVGADSGQEEITSFKGYNNSGDGDEHTHDRRQHHHHHQQQPHHHHHHHNQQLPHQNPHHKYANSKMSDNESNVNHVILITVINPHYPITCDLIHQICGTYGKVNRIVIFKKNGVQTMVEFDNVDAAKKAKSMLHGCDIYSGCCTLKVEFAKPTKLNVHKNDSDSYDYTNPNLSNTPNHHHTSSDSGPSDSNNQHHHHLHSSNHGVHNYINEPSGSHHQREPNISKRGSGHSGGGGVDVMNPGSGQSNSGAHSHHHHHHANHFHTSPPSAHSSNQHHSKHQSALGSGHHGALQSSSYIMGPSLDQPGSNNTDGSDNTFHHQDGGFNLSRSSAGGHGDQAPNFISGIDTFMSPSTGNSSHHLNSHGMHSTLYPRQDGHHQSHLQQSHYQSHHLSTRGGGPAGGIRGHGHHNPSFPPSNALMAGRSHLAPQGTVMMVYGLGIERVNCERLFNLFCLYGNVVRIKFLRSKEGCAMVQMGDVIAVDRCVSSLNKITLFGNEMQISYSKQAFLHEVLQPFTLPDGSPSFEDFMVNKNNRFRNPEVASKNKILPPSNILHFFNAPYGISDEELMMIFKQTAGHEPVALKIFTPKGAISALWSLRHRSEHCLPG